MGRLRQFLGVRERKGSENAQPSRPHSVGAQSVGPQAQPGNTNDTVARSLDLKGIWKEAYDKLQNEEPRLIEAFEKDLQQCSSNHHQGPASLSDIVQDKISNIERSRWKVTVAGKEVTVRDEVLRIVNAIVSVKESITTAVTTEPHAALAWAGILLVLNPLARALTQDDNAVQGLEKVCGIMIRYAVVETTHISVSAAKTDDAVETLICSVKANIVSLYAEILRYQIRIVHQFSQPTLARFLKALGVSGDWGQNLVSILEIDNALIKDLAVLDSQLLTRIKGVMEAGFAVSHAMLTKVLDETKAAKQRSLIDALPFVGDAVFDSYEDRDKARCLAGTQVNALQQIQAWVDDVRAPPIFWLNGQAGTGKSTISRTVAHEGFSGRRCGDKSPLSSDTHFAASFFFNYRQPARRNARRLFTTLSRSLANVLPDIQGHLSEAIQRYPDVATANPTSQWNHLIMGPLTKLDTEIAAPVRLIIVIDALDECEDLSDLDSIFQLLAQLKNLKTAQIRVFVTSRRVIYLCIHGQGQNNLDAMYARILQSYIIRPGDQPDEREDRVSRFKQVVGSVILFVEPVSVQVLSALTIAERSDVVELLGFFHSILSVPEHDDDGVVEPLHLSLRDYLLSKERCVDDYLWIDQQAQHEYLLQKCLHILSTTLKQNICDLDDPTVSIDDIPKATVDECIPGELRYACLYWVDHLRECKSPVYDNDRVYEFFKDHLLDWFEAIFLLRKGREGTMMIRELLSFILSPSDTRSPRFHAMVSDALRFVLTFRSMLDSAPLQLHSSALFFSPQNSIVRQQFKHRIPKTVELISEPDPHWSPLLQTLGTGRGPVRTVMFSPDEKSVLAASRSIQLWDVATGTLLMRLDFVNEIVQATFSQDGNRIVCIVEDEGIKACDIRSQVLTNIFECPRDQRIFFADFSPDRNLVAISAMAGASEDCTTSVLDLETCTPLHVFHHLKSTRFIKFSLDGRLVGYSTDKVINIIEVSSGRLTSVAEPLSSVIAFASDGRVISGSLERLWDPTEGQYVQTLLPTSSRVALSGNKEVLAVRAQSRKLCLWDTSTGARLATAEIDSFDRRPVLSPDGRYFTQISGRPTTSARSKSMESRTQVWDTKTRALVQTLEENSHGVSAAAFSPNGTLMVSGSHGSVVRVWDLSTKSAPHSPQRHGSRITSALLSADGRRLATVSDNLGGIKIWNMVTGTFEQTLEEPEDNLVEVPSSYQHLPVAFSRDGKLFASRCKTGSAQKFLIWDVPTGSLVQVANYEYWYARSMTFFGENTLLAFVSPQGPSVLTIATGKRDDIGCDVSHIGSIAVSPIGEILALGSLSGLITILKMDTQTPIMTFNCTEGYHALAISPDGRLLVSASHSALVVWDLHTGDEIGRRKFDGYHHVSRPFIDSYPHASPLSFSDDGQTIHTPKGQFELSRFCSLGFVPSTTEPTRELFVDGDKVYYGTMVVLILPEEYLVPRAAAAHDGTLAMCHESGRVTIIKFKPPQERM
ncbi:hypothetical protein BJY00DRAFT_318549 [Aspergillus carlsbadensis]|nr:hypothetical protein BJY00DRAFT_318549 [Aspergillus carlsbadensis]